MREKYIRMKKVKEKIVSSMFIVMLLAATLGTISVSAYEVSINDNENDANSKLKNLCIQGANSFYTSNHVEIENTASVYSKPTYKTISKDGKHELGLHKKTAYGGTVVVNKILPLYKSSDQGKTYSYKLGEAKGSQLYFLVGSYDGSNGATFYLSNFYGLLRN